jgi:hypothetical protein
VASANGNGALVWVARYHPPIKRESSDFFNIVAEIIDAGRAG